MKQIHLYLWILGILLIAVGMWCYSGKKEEFTTQTAANFWDTVSKLEDQSINPTTKNKYSDETSKLISKVSDPDPDDPNDLMPLTFSKYISIYSFAKSNRDVSGARAALFNNYDQLQTEMSTNLYDQTQVTNWNADALRQTCSKLDQLRSKFTIDYATLTGSMQDLSGTAINASAMRDENMAYQKALVPACPPGNLTADCRSLADQDKPVYDLMAKYDTVNNTLFSNELDISNNLQTVEQTYSVLGCTNPNKFFTNGTQTFWVNNGVKYRATGVWCNVVVDDNMKAPNRASQDFFDRLQNGPNFTCAMVNSSPAQFSSSVTGYIDTATLGMKLQELSPYHLSPDTLNYIMGAIASVSNTQEGVMRTSDYLIDLNNVINNIKALTGS